ncbi:MAG: outer membrane beta-barrel protein [Leadbetterella sp.]|nr:outer membrane beta-barrel protein [Leadbetterella sp.]
MKKLFLLFLFTFQLSHAQLITFTVTDGTEPIPGATLFFQLGTKTFAGATDTSGIARIALGENLRYKIRVSAVGFETLEQEILTHKNEFKIVLKASTTQLDEVAVIAKKPLITHEDDKDIVDPEPLTRSSTNVMEVLEKTPGIFSDTDGNFYLSSTTPAKIYINGREQRMGSGDLAALLRSLPPNAIEKIEIIRTPSATMDASNTGGTLNLILRKGYSIFGSGSISAGMNQGRYGNRFLNASYNRSAGKTTYYLNGGASVGENFNFVENQRNINITSRLDSRSESRSGEQNGMIGYGVAYDFTKKWTVSYDGQLSGGHSDNTNNTGTDSFHELEKEFTNQNDIHTEGRRVFVNQSLNSILKFDSIGSRKLLLDFSGSFLRPQSDQTYANTYSTKPGNTGAGHNSGTSGFYAIRAELTYLFKNRIKLETGGKLSMQDFGSRAEFTRTENAVTSPDLFRTNAFDFNNRISALYLQGTRSFGAFSLKTGLRLENTYMRGHQVIPSDTTFKVQRTDLFPFLFFGRKIASIMGMEMRATLVAQRTIDRPGYNQLNPFRQYLNEFTYQSGNPALKPQFSNNFEMNVSVEGTPILAIGQRHISDIFTSVLYQDTQNPQVTNRTYDNLAKNKETYFRLMGALPPGGKYFFVAGAQYTLNDYSGLYEGSPVHFRRGTWRFFTFHELKFNKQTSLTLNGFYMTKGQMQFTELGNFGNLNLSLNRRFMNDRLNLTLNASDVLFTNKFNFRISQGNMMATGSQYHDSRRFGINLRYNFGQKKRTENSFNPEMGTPDSGIQ